MASDNDIRLEGLRELGALIAEHYRRELRGEVSPLTPNPPIEENVRAIPVIVEIQPNGDYAEVVKIEDILRRKPRQRPGKKLA